MKVRNDLSALVLKEYTRGHNGAASLEMHLDTLPLVPTGVRMQLSNELQIIISNCNDFNAI